ncbi:Endothelin-converting enzyme 1 [Haplosporangium gracile]|nr:Endothelin-converting enzyme 1 [Haplosporangium gracile]
MFATKLQALMAIVITLGVAQAVLIDNPGNNTSPSSNKVICTTPQCVLTAYSILNDMDPTADPCQDFSRFTCGEFMERQKIPAGGEYINALWILHYSNEDIIRSIVDPKLGRSPETDPDDVAAQNNIRKMQDLFLSCMDIDTVLQAGRKPLVDQIKTIIHSLPSSESPANKNALSKTLALIVKYGFEFPGFIDLRVGVHETNRSVNVLNVNEGGLGLKSADDYMNAEVVLQYTGAMAAMFQIILGDEDVAIRTQPLTSQDLKQNWVDIARELSALTPSIDWSLLLQETFPAGFNDTRPLVVSSPVYLTKLDVLLSKNSAKSLQYYFAWVLIRNLAKHLSIPYAQPLVAFKTVATTVALIEGIQHVSTCIGVVSTNLMHIASHYFVQKTFKYQSHKDIIAIIETIMATYESDLPTVKWLDQYSRNGAIKKLKTMAKAVGYSINNPNATSSLILNEFYKDYTVVSDNYFANQLKYSLWSAAKSFAQLTLPHDREAMNIPPRYVFGSYVAAENSIKLGAGILRMPFFHIENPEYVNYGGIGAFIGHGIGWWSGETAQAFEKQSQCFVEQYGTFTAKGPDNKDINVNGRRTLRENIADNGDVKIAFKSWKDHFDFDPSGNNHPYNSSTRYRNFQLPGLEMYTPEQLFFISYSRVHCMTEMPALASRVTEFDTRSPAKWRVNGAAMNSPDFAEAFKCPVGSPMNPKKKCEVW